MRVQRTTHPTNRVFQSNYKGCAVIADAGQPDIPITFATRRFYDFTGYSEDEVVGNNCRFLQTSSTDPADTDPLRHSIEQSKPVSVSILNQTKEGIPFYNHLSMFPLNETSEKALMFAGYQNPITERMAHYQKLWDLNFEESLIADTLRGSFDLTDMANWLGIMNIDARAFLDNLLAKTGTLFANHENLRAKVGTDRQIDVINELLETFEQAETLRSSVRPNGVPGELVDDERTGLTHQLDRRSFSTWRDTNKYLVA